MRVLLLVVLCVAIVAATQTTSWLGLVQSKTPRDAPVVASSQLPLGGVELIKELPLRRHNMTLWHMTAASATQITDMRTRLSNTISLHYLSDRGDQRVTHSVAAVRPSGSTVSWALDVLDSSTGGLDGQYTNSLQGAGAHVYVVDTGVTENATDLTGRITYDWTAFSGQPYDAHGHGTHVAGSAAGTVYGTAKQAQVHSYRILDASGSGSLSDLASALVHIDNNFQSPAVINLSLEYGGFDPTIDALLQILVQDGVVVVAACGNEGARSCGYPALTAGVIAVGASTSSNLVASYSNQGNSVDFFAPGSNVLSDWLDGGTAILSGTSMATGVTSGVVALFRAQSPLASPAEISALLVTTSTKGVLVPSTLITGSPNRLLYAINTTPIPSSPSGTPPAPTPAPGPPPPSSAAAVSTTSISLLLIVIFFFF
jgi:subtilisin family serine protease